MRISDWSSDVCSSDLLTAFPELQELEMSEPMHYEVGDITVHTHLTIHGAGENRTERPRWSWILVAQPEDICWNGSPCPNFAYSAMKPWAPMGGDRQSTRLNSSH